MGSESKKNVLLLAVIVIYIVSPIDAVPGPIDDIILAIVGAILAGRTGLKQGDR